MICLTLAEIVALFKKEQWERGCICDMDYDSCPYVRENRWVSGVERGLIWLGGRP